MKFIEMSDYNPLAKTYWWIVVVVGALVGGWSCTQGFGFNSIQSAQFLALASLAVISSSYAVRIPGTTASISAGDTFTFLGVLFLGVPAAVVIGAIDSFFCSLRTTKRATSWLASPAVMAVTVFAAGHLFYSTLKTYTGVDAYPLGNTPLDFSQWLVPLVLMAFVQFTLNCFAIAAMFALKTRSSVWGFWRDGYLWTWWTFFIAAVAAALVHEAVLSYGILHMLLSISVVVATYATYKIYFKHVNEKTREVAERGRLHLATVEALATAIDAKDQTTHYHVRRVQIYAARMGQLFNLSDQEIEALRAGALLHDIGKLAVPDHILNKPGKLTPAEFEKMKIHTIVGAQILEKVDFSYPVVPIVLYHHEQWDGRGYPHGLRGEAIPLTARILAVVDCFDASREDRPYRKGMTREAAGQMLWRGAGTHFDPKIVDLFMRHVKRFDEELAELELDQHGLTAEECEPRALVETGAPPSGIAATTTTTTASSSGGMTANTTSSSSSSSPIPLAPPLYLNQIKNAHAEIYALYEIARTFGQSLDIERMAPLLIDKVNRIVPFDTCAVYLWNEERNCAQVAHAAGRNAELLNNRCVKHGEGIIGFVLANRSPVNQFDPMLDFADIALPEAECYRSVIALPLIKDERLLGALAVYATEVNRYTDDHLRLLDTIARLAADALTNALRHRAAEANAHSDALTGLPNARALHARFDEEAARTERTGHPFQVVMLDLDEFKQVNDSFGHKTGNVLLGEVSRLLQAQLRDYDFLARCGGDEFVILVQDLSPEQIEDLQMRIERAITGFSLHVKDGNCARVGISTGTATYGVNGKTLDALLIAADQAMYSVKSKHKQHRQRTAPSRAERVGRARNDKLEASDTDAEELSSSVN